VAWLRVQGEFRGEFRGHHRGEFRGHHTQPRRVPGASSGASSGDTIGATRPELRGYRRNAQEFEDRFTLTSHPNDGYDSRGARNGHSSDPRLPCSVATTSTRILSTTSSSASS
jgi:hypothetical protein